MTSPRSSYGGGYYASPAFADTPIYDSLVAERGTPQIAPIRVPSAYDTGSSYPPALPSALPALPAGPSASSAPSYGYPQQAQQQAPQGYQGYQAAQPVAPLQHAPAPYIPQQTRGGAPAPQQPYQPQRPQQGGPTGYEAMRPANPVPPRQAQRPAPGPYDDPYGRQYPPRGGY